MTKNVDKPAERSPVPRRTAPARVDLSAGALRVELRHEAWPAADLLMSMLAVIEKRAHRALETGTLWRERAAAVSGGYLATLDQYGKEVFINLLGLPYDVPAARSASGFVETLEALPPEELLRYLTGFYRRCFRRETPAAVIDAAIGGDPGARREFRRTSFPDDPPWGIVLRHLLSAPAATIAAEFAGLARRWLSEVYGPHAAAIEAEAERAQVAFRRATAELPLEQVVDRAAPGVTFVPEVGQTTVVLVPSVTIRPLWAVTDHRTANVFAYPAQVTERRVDPPARLVALGKAIGDTTRLRILRELATSPATPPDLADRLGMPRTTLLHHLRILRQADLVAVLVNDSQYHQYTVRDEQFGEVERLLDDYLG